MRRFFKLMISFKKESKFLLIVSLFWTFSKFSGPPMNSNNKKTPIILNSSNILPHITICTN